MKDLETMVGLAKVVIGTVVFVYYLLRNMINGKQPSKIGMIVVIVMLMEVQSL